MPVDANRPQGFDAPRPQGFDVNRPQYGAGARLAFLELFVAATPAERLHGLAPDTLFAHCDALYQFGLTRAPDQTLIRATVHDRAGVIELITTDMPHIVDGIVGLLHGDGVAILDLIHPIVPTIRDDSGVLRMLARDGVPESFIRVETDLADPARLTGLTAAILAMLDSLRAIERQAGACARIRQRLAARTGGEIGALLDWLGDEHFSTLGQIELTIGADGRVEGGARHGLTTGADGVLAALTPPAGDDDGVWSGRVATLSPITGRAGLDGLLVWSGRDSGAPGLLLLGHFTVAAQAKSPRQIPVLRHRVEAVLNHLEYLPRSHNARTALAVLEQTPRDALFAADIDTLAHMVRQVLDLQNKQRIHVTVTPDRFDALTVVQVLMPASRFEASLGERIAAIAADAVGGAAIGPAGVVPRGSLTAITIICAGRPDSQESAAAAAAAITAGTQAALRSWRDRLHAALAGQGAIWDRFATAFPSEYRDRHGVETALRDIADIDRADADGIAVHLGWGENIRGESVRAGGPSLHVPSLHVKLFHAAQPIQLYKVLPLMENLGARVIGEHALRLAPAGRPAVWLHDIAIELDHPAAAEDVPRLDRDFTALFLDLWHGRAENDGFNRLLFAAGLDGRRISWLRAYARYLRQIAPGIAQQTVERALTAQPALATALTTLFQERFDPLAGSERDTNVATLRTGLGHALDAMAAADDGPILSIDDERVLRLLANLIDATTRTNAFQTDSSGAPKPYVALKFDCARIADLPAPRPLAEIFVYSPRMEGTHLRGGKIARGGIRWSDRRDDFRTEILGLLKAQMVKNAVIVPQGAKGGFVVKTAIADPNAARAEAVACYGTLIRGLLDVTDNLDGARVVPPPQVVRADGDDPYLVVAADKGTATFSDIANAIAAEYGFWLGDAFASGGSKGYDHKAMAITTRGAWEAVKRHFRELGTDIQTKPFTMAGIGDMSGDVFGNACLRSPHTRLVAAFNHTHIFIDPQPDPARSWAERQRLFALPRSDWDDYDVAALSAGGGVFRRDARRVTLSPQAVALLGLDGDSHSPDTVIRAILTAPVDLLFFGGIGTYVRAGDESDASVGDRANDMVRVAAGALRARVIGEGANLGLTQRARIAFAQAGGRINTDAIDNSAGVDCSDHEVNIKILLAAAQAQGAMTSAQRDALLAGMTDDVAALVLQDNIDQTATLSMIERAGADRLDRQARLIRRLERAGRLDRALDHLPDDDALARRQALGQGLTRPEIATLLAHGKNWLTEEILAADLTADPYLRGELAGYFPDRLRQRLPRLIDDHPLARNILATRLANDAANRLGVATILHLAEETGASPALVVHAFVAARDALDLTDFWQAADQNDDLAAQARIDLTLVAAQSLERALDRMLRLGGATAPLAATVATWRRIAAALTGPTPAASLAERAARLDLAQAIPDIAAILAQAGDAQVDAICRLYRQSGTRLGLDWLQGSARRLPTASRWQRRELTDLIDDLGAHRRRLTAQIVAQTGAMANDDPLHHWLSRNSDRVGVLDQLIAEIRAADTMDLSMLSVANRALARLSA